MEIGIGAFIFLMGICVGSFLNVCIHRMPRDQSVVLPGSHCPKCKTPIHWYDNIPVLSYFILKGKCRACGESFSPRYALTELATGLMWTALYFVFGLSWMFVIAISYFSILLALSITDLETGYIPDKLSLPGLGLGLLFSGAYPLLHHETIWYWGLLRSVMGALGGGGFLLLVGLMGNLIFKKDSMGGGDIKLLAMIGAFLGVKEAIILFFFSPILALPVGLYAKFVKKEETIPFGPYLAIMGAIFFFVGDKIISYFFPTAFYY